MNPSLLTEILNQAEKGKSLTLTQITELLSLTRKSDIERVMESARKVRHHYFGNDVFLYGFVYGSTYCHNHCSFCFYRQGNTRSPRYRKSVNQVTTVAKGLADAGVHLIDLTFGEDPQMRESDGYATLLEMISEVKTQTGKPIMVSPGVVPDRIIHRMAQNGADWYALYQETHNHQIFGQLRVHQGFEERCAKRRTAARAGMLVEDGMLIGVGEQVSDWALTISAMKESGAAQVRVMSFVSQPETPLAHLKPIHRDHEYLVIAVMRLVMPDRLIPASLDVDGIQGLSPRLEAGANVVTSIIPPRASLAGVSQSALNIEDGMRSVSAVRRVLKSMNLKIAGDRAYAGWMVERHSHQQPSAVVRQQPVLHSPDKDMLRCLEGVRVSPVPDLTLHGG